MGAGKERVVLGGLDAMQSENSPWWSEGARGFLECLPDEGLLPSLTKEREGHCALDVLHWDHHVGGCQLVWGGGIRRNYSILFE